MRLERSFFERDSLTVARELVGCVLVHERPDGVLKGKIVETEAYLASRDAAAHSYKGKSDRVKALYGPKGVSYIYLIYGMHYCFNISSGDSDEPECVLIRALEPIEPCDLMIKRRGTDKPKNLCSGPGKLCRAMDIDKSLYGSDLCADGSSFYIEYGAPCETIVSRRINIDYAGEAKDYPYRFLEKGSSFVSHKPI